MTDSNPPSPLVGVIMGSKSDWETMQHASVMLKEFGVPHESRVLSAHRTPKETTEYVSSAEARGVQVVIAGAGGAAHLPGMVASLTPLPVIGVPVKSANSIDGWDSILSILQMPGGVPVATMALNGAKNAGILAAQIIGTFDPAVRQRVADYKKKLETDALGKVSALREEGWPNGFDSTPDSL